MDVGTRWITVSSLSGSKQLALNNNSLWFIFIATMAVNKIKHRMDTLVHNFIF